MQESGDVAKREKYERSQFLKYMPSVNDYALKLNKLEEWWQKITLVAKINSQNISAALLVDMEDTRSKFKGLQVKLVDNLVREIILKTEREMTARAQVAIDILIRNLFERTADVGFLATDDDLREFLKNQYLGSEDYAEKRAEEYETTVERLREYTAKYSVYDEIIVTDPSGNVQVHLDQDNPVEKITDSLLMQTLSTNEDYVETFKKTDLQPLQDSSLVYSCRIHERNEIESPVLGVLCLCFRFQDEMKGIFKHLAREEELLTILDKYHRVIASNDESLMPVGTRVEVVLDKKLKLVKHKGITYIAKTAETNGYQGYFGSGWLGHIMVPVVKAFEEDDTSNRIDQNLLQESFFFSQELGAIRKAAIIVNADLILVVLNGQIISARNEASEFTPILDAVRIIGSNTRAVFDNSITDLYNTVGSSLLSHVQFQATLAVDIMDRNLYERANDVRWWALTSRFREIMAQPEISSAEKETLNSILHYINSLYTVYTNLFIYDIQGVVVATSHSSEAHHIGKEFGDREFVESILKLNDTQQYEVSSFSKSRLYGERHTYVYHSPIRNKTSFNRVVGGIGIVFDSEPQFLEMLEDALPRNDDGQVLEGCFGVFADRSGRIVSSTLERLPPGEKFILSEQFFSLQQGERYSGIIEYEGSTYAVGAAMSEGYREYKTTNDYDNDIVALIFVAI